MANMPTVGYEVGRIVDKENKIKITSPNNVAPAIWNGYRIKALKDAAIVGIVATVGFVAFKAFETSPLWVPPLLAALGPIGWTILFWGGIGIGTVYLIGLIALGIATRQKDETLPAMLERWIWGRMSSALQVLPHLVTAVVQGVKAGGVKIFGNEQTRTDQARTELLRAEASVLAIAKNLRKVILAPTYEEHNKQRAFAGYKNNPLENTVKLCWTEISTWGLTAPRISDSHNTVTDETSCSDFEDPSSFNSRSTLSSTTTGTPSSESDKLPDEFGYTRPTYY